MQENRGQQGLIALLANAEYQGGKEYAQGPERTMMDQMQASEQQTGEYIGQAEDTEALWKPPGHPLQHQATKDNFFEYGINQYE